MNVKVPLSMTLSKLYGEITAFLALLAILLLSIWGIKVSLHGLFGWF